MALRFHRFWCFGFQSPYHQSRGAFQVPPWLHIPIVWSARSLSSCPWQNPGPGIRSGPGAYGPRGFITNNLFTWMRLGFLTFKSEEQTASEDAGEGLEDNVLEWKVLRRCELFWFQCLSALLSICIVTLENPATCPACLGFHLLRGLCLPLLFIQIFNSIHSPVPPAL